MKIPFTIDQFLKLFESYNLAVFPVQWLAYLLGAAVVLGILTKWTRCPQLTALILASMWIWNGAVYHIAFFSRINPLAYFSVRCSSSRACFFYGTASTGTISVSIPSGTYKTLRGDYLFYMPWASTPC
jgi:hypothetical protein